MCALPTAARFRLAEVQPVEVRVTGPHRRPLRDPLMWAGLVLIALGAALPHGALADAVVAAGGPAGLESGFRLLRIVAAATGVLLAGAAYGNVGHSGIGVVRPTAPAPIHWSVTDAIALSALVVLAIGVRVPALNAQYWLDEMFTVMDFVRPPFVAIVTSFESQNNHPLYSLLANALVSVFGESPWVLRLPAVLFGVAGVAALYWFAIQVTSRTEAVLSAALLTVSYHHVWFSQNARAYTALLCFALVGTGLFLRLCREQSTGLRSTALAYAAVMTLAVYSHMTAALIVAAHFAVWVIAVAVRGRWRDAWRTAPALAVAVAGSFSLVLYAPGLGHIASGLGGAGEQVEMVWKNPLWMLVETARGLARGVPGGVPTLAIAAIAPVAGVISFARRDRVLTALMLAPAVLTAAMLVATRHNLWPRFFFFAAGFAIVITVRGVFALAARQKWVPARPAAVTVTAAVIAASAALLPAAWGAKQDFTSALTYVQNARAPGDVVAVTGIADWVYHDFYPTDWTSVKDASSLRELASAEGRTWLVHVMPELIAARTPELWSEMQAFEEITTFRGTLAGGTVHIGVSR